MNRLPKNKYIIKRKVNNKLSNKIIGTITGISYYLFIAIITMNFNPFSYEWIYKLFYILIMIALITFVIGMNDALNHIEKEINK